MSIHNEARYIHSKDKARRQRDNWKARALAAEAKLADWEASVAAAMRQPCGEAHCSCVGPLVEEVERLKAEGDRMRGEAR